MSRLAEAIRNIRHNYCSAVVVAAGSSTRMGEDKLQITVGGKSVLLRSLEALDSSPDIDEIIVVTGINDISLFKELSLKYGFRKISAVIQGGSTRAESVYNGLTHANGDIVLIHDGARMLITTEEIEQVFDDCKKFGAAALGVKCKDTLKINNGGFIAGTLDRETTYQIQTPQAFYKDTIIKAHQNAKDNTATDDCALVEKIGVKIKITEGSYENIKITTPSDLAIAHEILKKRGEI